MSADRQTETHTHKVYLLLEIGTLASIVTLCLAQSYRHSVLSIVTFLLTLTVSGAAVVLLLTSVRPMALRHGLTTACAPSRLTPVLRM